MTCEARGFRSAGSGAAGSLEADSVEGGSGASRMEVTAFFFFLLLLLLLLSSAPPSSLTGGLPPLGSSTSNCVEYLFFPADLIWLNGDFGGGDFSAESEAFSGDLTFANVGSSDLRMTLPARFDFAEKDDEVEEDGATSLPLDGGRWVAEEGRAVADPDVVLSEERLTAEPRAEFGSCGFSALVGGAAAASFFALTLRRVGIGLNASACSSAAFFSCLNATFRSEIDWRRCSVAAVVVVSREETGLDALLFEPLEEVDGVSDGRLVAEEACTGITGFFFADVVVASTEAAEFRLVDPLAVAVAAGALA
jgi:hypothetical protein